MKKVPSYVEVFFILPFVKNNTVYGGSTYFELLLYCPKSFFIWFGVTYLLCSFWPISLFTWADHFTYTKNNFKLFQNFLKCCTDCCLADCNYIMQDNIMICLINPKYVTHIYLHDGRFYKKTVTTLLLLRYVESCRVWFACLCSSGLVSSNNI